MITRNHLGKLVGPSAVFSGYILLIFGAITVYFTFMAIPLILIGSIMAFSYEEVYINEEEKKYKYQIKISGFIPAGSFKRFQSGDEIRLKHVKGKYTTYSKTYRKNTLTIFNYKVYLIESDTGKKITLGRFDTEQDAIKETNRLTAIIQSIKE